MPKYEFDAVRWLRENMLKCAVEIERFRMADDLHQQGAEQMRGDNAKLRARVARLEEALPDPHKLEILAAWFDWNFEDDRNPEVQNDLREWAKKIRRALEEK